MFQRLKGCRPAIATSAPILSLTLGKNEVGVSSGSRHVQIDGCWRLLSTHDLVGVFDREIPNDHPMRAAMSGQGTPSRVQGKVDSQ